ncbi:hypothetical protein BVC80_949g13 [Macleaya cordata]|uniref:Uncharacterized protein n=1 Tax=Macleaya cordata TaxID=56857 RepID=A0A200QWZ1_MACCD|nr:hypothetical protein BVC80_949g13 [Macleaya cordata]
MASSTFYCICFSSPPNIPSEKPTTKEEICSKEISWSRGSSQAAARIGFTHSADLRKRLYTHQHSGMKILSCNSPSRAKYTVDLRCRDYLTTTLARHHSGPVVRNLTEFSGINVVIFGYWVGPDIDDGWGYTEAVVDRSSF